MSHLVENNNNSTHNLAIPFYRHNPVNNELVSIIITEKTEADDFKGKLVEYNKFVYLKKEDAPKKKKHASWKDVVPIGRELIASIDNIDFAPDTVQISMKFINSKEQESVLEIFKKNKKLISLIKSISYQNNINIDTLWSSIIYKIDDKRRNDYDIKDIPSLLQYCIEEIDVLDEINENLLFKKTIMDFMKETPYKISSTICIISYIGVQYIHDLLKEALNNNINYKYSLSYTYYKKKKTDQKSFPSYIFETNSEDSTENDHSNLITFLETKAKQIGPNLLIRVFEKCKKNIT